MVKLEEEDFSFRQKKKEVVENGSKIEESRRSKRKKII